MKHFQRFTGGNRSRQVMAVAQGQTLGQLSDCFRQLQNMPWIDTIALPRIVNNMFGPEARLDFVHRNQGNITKPVHFLGSTYHYPGEMFNAHLSGLVRSMDTSLPYVLALAGKQIGEADYVIKDELFKRPVDYFNFIPSPAVMEVISRNVATCLNWVGYQKTS
jgi:hypothetical protein